MFNRIKREVCFSLNKLLIILIKQKLISQRANYDHPRSHKTAGNSKDMKGKRINSKGELKVKQRLQKINTGVELYIHTHI